MTRIASLSMVLSLLVLAACSSVTDPLGMEDPFAIPQPFKGVERNDSMIGEAIRLTVLVVAVPGGIPEDRAIALRDRVVEVAQAHDVPALAAATVKAWTLSGDAAEVQTMGSKRASQQVISWRLADPEGVERAKFSVAYKATEAALGDATLRVLAEQTATALEAALIRPSTQIAQTITAVKKPIAWVGAIKGAPGDGRVSLARALTGVLPFKGIAVEATQAKAEWRIEGLIKVAPGPVGKDLVTLTWRVLDAKGREAGTIAQENVVPRGRLQKPWAEIAGFAAEAAAEGIAQLIQQVTSSRQG
jgi:hypothetical protein